MPHLLQQILSYLEAPDKLRLAVALDDVREMMEDNRLYRTLKLDVPLLRRGFVDRQGFWVNNEGCRGSLVFMDSGDRLQTMLKLLQEDIINDPWLDESLQVSLVLAKCKEEAATVGRILTETNISHFVALGPLSPKSTFRIRQHQGIKLGNHEIIDRQLGNYFNL
jgi:hypothetical protein